MADIELVIKIPEEIEIAIKRMGLLRIPDEIQKKVDKAIQHGTPLPKGHGDLIDRNELLKKEVWGTFGETGYDAPCVFKADVNDAQAIIKADKAESEE